jgi:hypothetical protein
MASFQAKIRVNHAVRPPRRRRVGPAQRASPLEPPPRFSEPPELQPRLLPRPPRSAASRAIASRLTLSRSAIRMLRAAMISNTAAYFSTNSQTRSRCCGFKLRYAATDGLQTLLWREPDSNLRYRGRRRACGRSLPAQRVETDPAKGVRIRQSLACAVLRREWWARRRPVRCVSDPRGRAAREPAGADRAPSCSPSSGWCASNRTAASSAAFSSRSIVSLRPTAVAQKVRTLPAASSSRVTSACAAVNSA